MSASFNPDDKSQEDEPWATVFLSNRDLSGQVPINFVTHPGISLTSACFASGTYDPVLAQTCLSNLLAGEFRRFILDVYWDHNARQYTLCPVAIPGNNATSEAVTSTTVPVSTTASSTLSISGRSRSGSTIIPNQQSTRNGTLTTTSTSAPKSNISATVSSSAPVTSSTDSAGQVLLQLGPYLCSSSLNLQWVASLFLDFFQQTSDTIQAKVIFVEISLHAAAASDDPVAPPQSARGNELPQSNEYVGDLFTTTMSDYIYQPALLQTERSDLNDSWLGAPTNELPILEFFTTQVLDNGALTTPNGWPSENYVLISKAMRLLLSWGRIDPQMQGYDFSGDNNTIFSATDIIETRSFDANGAGDLISGCFYQAGSTGVGKVNSSWALTVQNQLFPALINNISSCGISPTLNNTLENTMANDNATPYNSYVRAEVWNWATGEPQNKTAAGTDTDSTQTPFRCAILDSSSGYKGHWRVENCQSKYPVACRVNNQPYEWVLSSNHVVYSAGPSACPANASFDVPRTGLENKYLYRKIVEQPASSGNSGGSINGVWINFNSLDVVQCWVDTGPNGVCPYYEDPAALQTRSILVPTIGALIVLLLTVLTLFVKCNTNHRRNAKTRRRGIGLGAWEYEGVPS